MRQVLSFLVILVGVAGINGLKCHKCFEFAKECPPATLKNCTGTYCFKFRAYYKDKSVVEKGCTDRADIGCRKKNYKIPLIFEARGDYCACEKDFCNNSKMLTSSLLAVISMLITFTLAV